MFIKTKKILQFNKKNELKFKKFMNLDLINIIFKYLLNDLNHLQRVLIKRKENLIEPSKFWFFEINLEGLGFKINKEISLNNNYIHMDLGFSHGISLKIPSDIYVIIRKKKILLKSKNKILLGNFVVKLIRLKPQNSYKNLGFFIPYNKKELKKINVLK